MQLPLDAGWRDFAVEGAITFWKEIGPELCILSHLSCHIYVNDRFFAGFSPSERKKIEKNHPRVLFAYDGLRLEI